MRIRVVAALTLLALLALGGCGDDDGDSDGGSAGESGVLTRSEFAEQANQVCKGLTENGELVVDERLIGRVDQLAPPNAEQDTVTQLLDQWRDYLGDLSPQTATAANEIARELGLDECVIST